MVWECTPSLEVNEIVGKDFNFSVELINGMVKLCVDVSCLL